MLKTDTNEPRELELVFEALKVPRTFDNNVPLMVE